MDCEGNVTIQDSLAETNKRALQEGFTMVDSETVLAEREQLPVEERNYGNSPAYRHIGPVA